MEEQQKIFNDKNEENNAITSERKSFSIQHDWNPKQARLKETILKPQFFDEAIQLTLGLHAMIHSCVVSGAENTFFDEIMDRIKGSRVFNEVTGDQNRTIAYHIWHITRIEDICANLLITGGNQVINESDFLKRTKSTITETGNSLATAEIMDFSQKINMSELLNYRIAVGKRTREVLSVLKPADMKLKPSKDRLKRVIDEKAVSEKPEAIWLIDFWGSKNIAGLIQMPLTRHQLVHLSDCLKIKKKGRLWLAKE